MMIPLILPVVMVVLSNGDPVLQAAITAVVKDVAHKYNVTYTAAVVFDTAEVTAAT